MRTRSPERCTVPSMIPSTLSSRAISGNDFFDCLYCMEEVREITFTEPICARSVIRASVMPSEKYSCAGSAERLCRGNTAREWMEGAPLAPLSPSRLAFTAIHETDRKTAALTTPATVHHLPTPVPLTSP